MGYNSALYANIYPTVFDDMLHFNQPGTHIMYVIFLLADFFATWYHFQCNINETVILEAANLMKKYGLVVCHQFWLIDRFILNRIFCCRMLVIIGWILTIVTLSAIALKTGISSLVSLHLLYSCTSSTYGLVWKDKTRFPSGMKYLTDQIHDLGMWGFSRMLLVVQLIMEQLCYSGMPES